MVGFYCIVEPTMHGYIYGRGVSNQEGYHIILP